MNNNNFKVYLDNIWLLKEPNRLSMFKLVRENQEKIVAAPGSKSKHQAWPGGFIDHTNEVIKIAKALYKSMNSVYPLPFDLADAYLVLNLHDLEKPFKYWKEPDDFSVNLPNEFKVILFEKYEFQLSDEVRNALEYIHGEEGSHGESRVMGPLAAFCHMCDIASARIWYDYPPKELRHNEPIT